MKYLITLLVLLLNLCVFCVDVPQSNLKLHVPSPDWRDQIIYFIMTDRFNDGDKTNNDQGKGEYNPKDSSKFSGGDIKGIIDKIGYIKDLGATAIWITPPVSNQWWDPVCQYGGYHGYWAVNFKEIDKHLGSIDDYKKLSDALHKRGMYLVQDIVCNHMGNFFGYNGKYDPKDPTKNFINYTNSTPEKTPTQYPFSKNNINNNEDRQIAAYHWTPDIEDFNDQNQVHTYQLANLDDINTENPEVRNALKESYRYWIRNVGVDGFRIDTVIYVPHDFWIDFIHGKNGIDEAAAETGRNNFLSFGEAFVLGQPFTDKAEKEISKYIGTDSNPELSAVLNFPLYSALNKVFAEGKPTNILSYTLRKFTDRTIIHNPYVIPNFIDNHDVSRFLSKSGIPELKLALTVLMTIPGIPVIYYGTEQGFKEQRGSMFATGYGSGGIDNFNENSNLYVFIKTLVELRKKYDVFRRGELNVLKDNESGAGIFVYKMSYMGKSAIILLNSSGNEMLADNIPTSLKPGTYLTPIFTSGKERILIVDNNKSITTTISPKGIIVLLSGGVIQKENKSTPEITILSKINGKTIAANTTIKGLYSGGNKLRLVIDSNLSNSETIYVQDNNEWETELRISNFAAGKKIHSLMIYDPALDVCSEQMNFYSNIEFGRSSDISKIDIGRISNNYKAPSADTGYEDYMKIDGVKVYTAGLNLKITLSMRNVSDIWKPDNNFDHVCFNIYLDIPGKPGIKILPKINAMAPLDFEWSHMSFSQGWTNGMYTCNGATKDNWGTAGFPAPKIEVDKPNRTISFIYSPEALGYPQTLQGTKMFITTWDYDGGYRQLTKEGGQWIFGGGDGKKDPLIMDHSDIITIE